MRSAGALLAVALLTWVLPQLASGPASVVHYRDAPGSVVSASIYAWRDGSAPVRLTTVAARPGKSIDLTASAGDRVLVVLARGDGAYLVDGPFAWPDQEGERAVDTEWRRTIGGRSSGASMSGVPLEWVTAVHDVGSAWPRCLWSDAGRWECWGATIDDVGVVLASTPGTLWWTIASAEEVREWRAGEWGRLLLIRAQDGRPPSGLRVVVAQPVAPPPQRLRTVRLDTAEMNTIQATPLAGGAVWIAGARPPPRAWAEVRATGEGPKYVPLEDLSAGPSALRVPIVLEAARQIEGIVSGGGAVARGALITLFRLIDPPPQPNDRVKPRRVFAAESTTVEDGGYRFEDLGEADYEIVAWHPQLGRAAMVVPPTRERLDVQLELPGIARGRVLQGGRPVNGVEVFSLPDPVAFTSADDPVDVKGGDGRTGTDGRFVLSLAASGGGELRIGGGAYAVKRVALPSAVTPIVDLGDIELGASFEITAVLDQDPGCDLRAVGPVGRTGLHILSGTRAGPGLFKIAIPEEGLWEFGLACGRTTRTLAPSVVQIGAANGGKEVHFAVK